MRQVSTGGKNGNATTIAYSGAFTSKVTAASGRTLTFANDGKQITKSPTTPAGPPPTRGSGDDLKTFTDTDGKTTVFDYDTSHRMTKVTTPEGRETRFTWDTNRLASITRVVDKTAGTGATTAFRYRTSFAVLRLQAGGEANRVAATRSVAVSFRRSRTRRAS
ncbi:hypothetical protein ACFYRY_10425 [Streptomyces sp. NPDC005263]|uniref:hypothetical protein n=1 Tax=Streptomyces sp. NPDC005263 TaxID=3364711 RepID=UPI003691504F